MVDYESWAAARVERHSRDAFRKCLFTRKGISAWRWDSGDGNVFGVSIDRCH